MFNCFVYYRHKLSKNINLYVNYVTINLNIQYQIEKTNNINTIKIYKNVQNIYKP